MSAARSKTIRSVADRKSTRLNSSHVKISYAVFCLKKKKKQRRAGRFHAYRTVVVQASASLSHPRAVGFFFFFNDTEPTEIYTLSLHDALPISPLLANLYLHHVFDLWADWWRRRRAHGDVIIVRFADDVTVGFAHERDARRFWSEL